VTSSVRTESLEADLRDFARVLVQAGLGTAEDRLDELVSAVRAELPDTDAAVLSRAWLVAAERQWREAAADWPAGTDHDRLQAAFAECEMHDLPVLQGVDDLAEVRRRVEASGSALRGVAWFGRRAVWDAIGHGVLAVELRHADGTGVLEGEHLGRALVTCLERHGLQVRFVGGRVEVATRWQRRPGV
jgi:hypothetical protein